MIPASRQATTVVSREAINPNKIKMTAPKSRTNYKEKRDVALREKIDARKSAILKGLSSGPAKAATFHQDQGHRDRSVTMDSLIELRNESKITYNNIHKAWAKR